MCPVHIGHHNPQTEDGNGGKQWGCFGASRLFLEAYAEQYFVETAVSEKQTREAREARPWL